MLSDRKKRNILVWLIIAVICVSYLGTEGLYNSKVRNCSAGSVATLGGNRSIDSGNNDMLGVVDTSYGLSIQQRNLNPGNSEKRQSRLGCLHLQFLPCFFGSYTACQHLPGDMPGRPAAAGGCC